MSATTAQAACAIRGIPILTIPENAREDGYFLCFDIVTNAGSVKADLRSGTFGSACCIGSAVALAAAGIISPDWIISDRKSWCVAFGESEPSLKIGGRGRPKGRYMSIDTYCAPGNFRVRWETTHHERDDYALRVDELSRSGKLKKHHEDDKPAAPLPPETDQFCSRVDDAITWLREQMKNTGCTYTPESMNRIHQAFEGVRRAFADGCVVPEVPAVPKFQRVGNVICWPGRGNVAPVSPAPLLS